MKSRVWILMLTILAFMPASICHAQLSLVLGSAAVTLDPAKVTQVKAATAGTRFYYDTNSDGKMDECWFIDTDPRHTSAHTPILVKVIDGDGDLAQGQEPDHDSDLYIADWNANGAADVAVGYEDYDHDNDMDAMAMYYPSGSTVRAWWSRDDGDDNLLWWDNDYQYTQDPCQHHTHFGGDETFFNLEFNAATHTWAPVWEAPFFFIDNNHDKKSDEVIRVTVNNVNQVATLRWSFDVNPQATSDADPRNYDCSISAYPPVGLTIGGANATTGVLHGYTITDMLKYTSKTWLNSVAWSKGLFTWVENDNNVGWATGGAYPYTSERWEGVIANGATNFGAIGGPTCGPFNNRNELNLNAGPYEYYFNPADKRIHLKSASQGWTSVDWDSNYAADMQYNWTDATGSDGLFDHIALDLDGNGSIDDQWDVATNAVQPLAFDYQAFHDAYAPVLQDYPAQLYALDRALAAALESVQAGSSSDAVWNLIENRFSNSTMPEWKRVKFLGSDITLIYYMELVRDRRIARLKTLASSQTSFWTSFNAARTAGNTTTMASLLGSQFGPATPNWAAYTQWITSLRVDATPHVGSSSVGANGIAWETEDAAWRIVNGQFDFFGKRDKGLVLGSVVLSQDLSTDNGTSWGMDSLVEGTGPGAGGLTLYVNGTAYPLYGSAVGSATYRVVDSTSERVTVEMVITNVGPTAAPRTVRIRAIATAGRSDTQIQGSVEGGPATDTVELGIGLIRPADAYYEHRASSGIVGIWGFQNPAIGWIGLGMIYTPGDFSRIVASANEIDVVLNARQGQYTNWTIKNAWLRGRRFSAFPTGPDWLNDLAATAPTIVLPPVSAAGPGWMMLR